VFRRFRAMPRGLQFFTASSMAAPLSLVQTIVPGGYVTFASHRIAKALWWSCGAGAVWAVPALLITLGALGMLRRARGSRGLFVCGALLAYPAVLWITRLVLGRTDTGLVSVAFGVIPFLGMAAYLYASTAIRTYFRDDGSRGVAAS
jgi:bacteriorhodopsin